MNTIPSDLKFKFDQNYLSAPSVKSTVSTNGHTRDRLLGVNRDDIFNVEMELTGAQFDVFETFVKNNPDEFIGTYFDSDVSQSATMRVVGGIYAYRKLGEVMWSVTMQVEVMNRNHATGEEIYDLANAAGSDLNLLGSIAGTMSVVVNENSL
jgi:hypothetical protein